MLGVNDNSLNLYASGLRGSAGQVGYESGLTSTVSIGSFSDIEDSIIIIENNKTTYNTQSSQINANLAGKTSLVLCKNQKYPSDIGCIRFYFIKIYEENELKCDLIPIRDSDGLVCLYDLITDTNYYAEGGELIPGEEI